MPLLGDCAMLPIDAFNELFQHTWKRRSNQTEPYRNVVN